MNDRPGEPSVTMVKFFVVENTLLVSLHTNVVSSTLIGMECDWYTLDCYCFDAVQVTVQG